MTILENKELIIPCQSILGVEIKRNYSYTKTFNQVLQQIGELSIILDLKCENFKFCILFKNNDFNESTIPDSINKFKNFVKMFLNVDIVIGVITKDIFFKRRTDVVNNIYHDLRDINDNINSRFDEMKDLLLKIDDKVKKLLNK